MIATHFPVTGVGTGLGLRSLQPQHLASQGAGCCALGASHGDPNGWPNWGKFVSVGAWFRSCAWQSQGGLLAGVRARRDRYAHNPEAQLRELVRYLLQNAVIDFQGEITMDKVRELLRDEDSREARVLLSKLIDDKGVDELLVTIADCLKDHIATGITEATLREQLSVYADS